MSMLSNKDIVCPNNLLDVAHTKKGVKVAIVNAGKPLPMLSTQDAVNENLIEPVFIGDENLRALAGNRGGPCLSAVPCGGTKRGERVPDAA